MENPTGVVRGNSQNVPEANVPRTRSTFPLGYHFFDTHRFGEYHPHYVAEGEKGDVLPIRSSHEVRSFTLKSPLMQNVSLKKDYFSVPMEAILPLNWEKFYANPVRGDDVLSNVGPSVENFWQKIGSFFNSLLSQLDSILSNNQLNPENKLTAFFRFLILSENFYSNGNLLSSLGCHGSPYLRIVKEASEEVISYDAFFDEMISELLSQLSDDAYFNLSVGGYSYVVGKDNLPFQPGVISFRHALQLMRDDLTFTVSRVYSTDDISQALSHRLREYIFSPILGQVPLRLARLWAYQLVCAHYYTNDHIDFIYSANLFRELVGYYVRTSLMTFSQGIMGRLQFNYNGITYYYDSLSAANFDNILFVSSHVNILPLLLYASTTPVQCCLGYFSALFSYRRSLRYLDYFTGSRAQPLAVGNTGVAVVNNSVDVVNITRNIQGQRFLNAVNRIRHSFEGYLKGLFGGEMPAPDYHNPFFLAHTDDIVFGQETENTGAAQVSSPLAITTNFRSNGSRYMFEINCDRPCILIGLSSYDIPRVYSKSSERSFFWVDRFDMFNPFMQFVGDQPVYLQELGISVGNLVTMSNFSYSLRHMEYKQRFNQAAGGFIENLPGFCFLALDERGNQQTINPDWIRSVNSEFDNFYVSLSGWSLGSYFHFIVDNFNDCSGSRPMVYAPSIL